MAEHMYGEEWDSDEFQTALKVVLKCEIQSLLERLSETGEETVLLTASAADLCVGHLASSKALRFVNTTDVGIVKNKFLYFLTGNVAQVSPVINNITPKGPVQAPAPQSVAKKLNTKAVTPNQTKVAEKRPLEAVAASPDISLSSLDAKRRKTESQPNLAKGNSITSLQTSTNPSVTQVMASSTGKGPAPKLKTTKFVSKSGGFTEEKISDAEFQKFLAQYKPNIPEGDEEEDGDQTKNIAMLRSGSMPQATLQKQFQPSPVSSVQNTQSKVTSLVNSLTDKNIKTGIQSGKNQSTQLAEMKKDNSSVKLENKSVNKENRENVNTSNVELLTEIKEELDPDDTQYKEAQAAVKKENELNVSKEKDKNVTVAGNTQKKDTCGQSDRTGQPSQNRNRLESIDNLDTETLIQMTKAKHLENMSEADREIQAKLGQLSSKLSWVVEYPKEKGQSGPSGQVTPVQRTRVSESSEMAAARLMHHGPYRDSQADDFEEMEDDDFEDDEDEFDEEDLDDEDKATLKAMREAHMRKLNAGMVQFGEGEDMYAEGFGVSQNFHPAMGQDFPQDYEEDEDYEELEEYNSEEEMGANMAQLGHNRIHGTLPNLTGPGMVQGHGEGPSVSGHQPYQRTASPTSENFLMIGPIMAKCLICNKIVRKTEMKSHHETHLNEEPYDEEEEEEEDIEEMEENIQDEDGGAFQEKQKTLQGEYNPEEGEYPPEEGEYAENEGEYPQEEGEYPEEFEFQAEEAEDGMEYTAEKFVAEKLVAEKVEDISDTSKECKDNVCDICNKSFKSHGNMIRHRKNIHKEETKEVNLDSCPVCGKSFRHLQKHVKKMHPEFGDQSQSGEVNENSGDSKLDCNICGELFTEEEKLKEHFKVHA
ncbi:eukaryotic translation initiation factor 5B-like isoform X2 [Mercenaria mercenaria]|uniref:eukaryotic translation initiation factor 5B-like isoform X2 n=1 Tax=Mercenaria mercenaria TaxID=6596 RepID=UPI00234EDC1C|nr:eukaryotic translation initiation factor 5B-like isoform X2 [Mercenaria mercenaria]